MEKGGRMVVGHVEMQMENVLKITSTSMVSGIKVGIQVTRKVIRKVTRKVIRKVTRKVVRKVTRIVC